MQNECSYCRRGMGKHEDYCPIIHSDAKAAIALYNTGWDAGRRGQQMRPQLHLHPIYRMGYGNGEVALEAAQNGHRPY